MTLPSKLMEDSEEPEEELEEYLGEIWFDFRFSWIYLVFFGHGLGGGHFHELKGILSEIYSNPDLETNLCQVAVGVSSLSLLSSSKPSLPAIGILNLLYLASIGLGLHHEKSTLSMSFRLSSSFNFIWFSIWEIEVYTLCFFSRIWTSFSMTSLKWVGIESSSS